MYAHLQILAGPILAVLHLQILVILAEVLQQGHRPHACLYQSPFQHANRYQEALMIHLHLPCNLNHLHRFHSFPFRLAQLHLLKTNLMRMS